MARNKLETGLRTLSQKRFCKQQVLGYLSKIAPQRPENNIQMAATLNTFLFTFPQYLKKKYKQINNTDK